MLRIKAVSQDMLMGQKWGVRGKRGTEHDHICSLGDGNDGVSFHGAADKHGQSRFGRQSGTHLDILQSSLGRATSNAY